MKNNYSGISLIEITLTLAILALLVFQVGIPGLSQAVDKVAADKVMKNITTAVALARQTAIIENKMVTYCRSDNGLQCRGKWHEGSIIFTDANADHILNEDDRLIYRFNSLTTRGELTFNSFGNKQYLQLNPRGYTNYQSGNFTFCPDNKNANLARQLIISLSGRTRLARDYDKDGIVENSQGKPLTCK